MLPVAVAVECAGKPAGPLAAQEFPTEWGAVGRGRLAGNEEPSLGRSWEMSWGSIHLAFGEPAVGVLLIP